MVLKFIILVFFVESVLCNALKNQDNKPGEAHKNFFEKCEGDCEKRTKPVSLKFYLYTKKNPDSRQLIIPNDKESIIKSNFDFNRPTRFITHGFRATVDSDINRVLRNAFLTNDDLNVFYVDWGSCAQTSFDDYFNARCCVEDVGTQIAEFVDFLNSNFKLKFKDLLITGHSLGAHVMGYVGKKVKNGRINTIVGLDPAGPCFSVNLTTKRLYSSDAKYVETIHTSGDWLGFMQPIGHASFYPNYGKHQKGCGFDKGCSHSLSYNFYAESIIANKFVAYKCKDYDALLSYRCCIKTNLKMGGNPSNNGSSPNGIFVVHTNEKNLYGTGK